MGEILVGQKKKKRKKEKKNEEAEKRGEEKEERGREKVILLYSSGEMPQ